MEYYKLINEWFCNTLDKAFDVLGQGGIMQKPHPANPQLNYVFKWMSMGFITPMSPQP